MTTANETLRAAMTIISGARRESHGAPERSFATISAMWASYIDSRITAELARRGGDETFEDNGLTGLGVMNEADVCRMMVLLKMARAANGADPDHDLDAVGYGALARELSTEKCEKLQGTGPEMGYPVTAS